MNAQQIANRPTDPFSGMSPCAAPRCTDWGNTASILFRGGSEAVCKAHALLEADALRRYAEELHRAAGESAGAYHRRLAALAEMVSKASCERCGKSPYTPGFPGLCLDCSDWVFR